MKKFIYIIKNDIGLIKVGVSNDVSKRLKSIKNSSGINCSLVTKFGPFYNFFEVESAIHSDLMEFRQCGEWFRCDSIVAYDVCSSLCSILGDDKNQGQALDTEKVSTPSQQAKQAGYKSLQELSELSGWPIRSIQRMPKAHPKRFNTVLNGAKANAKEGEE